MRLGAAFRETAIWCCPFVGIEFFTVAVDQKWLRFGFMGVGAVNGVLVAVVTVNRSFFRTAVDEYGV